MSVKRSSQTDWLTAHTNHTFLPSPQRSSDTSGSLQMICWTSPSFSTPLCTVSLSFLQSSERRGLETSCMEHRPHRAQCPWLTTTSLHTSHLLSSDPASERRACSEYQTHFLKRGKKNLKKKKSNTRLADSMKRGRREERRKQEENKTTEQERKGISHHTITFVLMPEWWEIKRVKSRYSSRRLEGT